MPTGRRCETLGIIWLDMKYFALILLLLFTTAQGHTLQQTCGFVALVNKNVITEANYLAALMDYKEELVSQMSQQGKTNAKLDVKSDHTKSVVLSNLIDEMLLDQKAEEMRLEDNPEIRNIIRNPALLTDPDYADDFDPPDFAEPLRSQGIDLQLYRDSWRKKVLRQVVIQKEVLAPIFESISDEDRRQYYEAHKGEFMLPAKVTLSEVFLPIDSRSEAEVEYRAASVLAELRAGSDFIKSVKENTPVSRMSYSAGGHLGSFALEELRESLLVAISKLNPGDFTDPIRVDEGYMIIRLDARIPSTLRSYEQREVQQRISRAITMSRSEEARKNYMIELRKKAQIQICSSR